MRTGYPEQLKGVPNRRDQDNDAIPRIAPKWLKYDRQVGIFMHIGKWLDQRPFLLLEFISIIFIFINLNSMIRTSLFNLKIKFKTF